MKSKLIILALLICINLFSQFNEKDVLMRRANQLSGQRKFEQANKIYRELMETYPDDYQIIDRLISNYIVTSQFDSADRLLERNRKHFPEINYTQRKISILLAKGNIEQAQDVAAGFMDKETVNISNYRSIAMIFEQQRHFEIAADYYYEARKISKDEDLFARELATNLQRSSKFEASIDEFFRFVSKNTNFKNFVLNNVKTMYDQDSSIVQYVNHKLRNSKDETLLEIQALMLAYAQQYEKALSIYKKLSPHHLINFANQQFAQKNLDVALNAYLGYILLVDETTAIADVKVRIARLYMFKHDYETAKQYLEEVYSDEEIQSNRVRNRTRANKESRELLAEIAIIQDKPKGEVLSYFQDAKEYAMNMRERYELEFRMVHYLMMIGEIQESKRNLQILSQQQEPGSASYKLSFYYKYLLSLLQQSEEADSLLTELMVNMPESEETRQALQLHFLATELTEDEWEMFAHAFKKKELYHIADAVSVINSIESDNEFLQALAGNWARNYHLLELAKEVFSNDFTDKDIQHYAKLQDIMINKRDGRLTREEILTFLQEYPASFLAPNYRYLLNTRE